MLVLPDVFPKPEVWAAASCAVPGRIRRVACRKVLPDFVFTMAEAYWDLESTLPTTRFPDYAYDKRLYDRLRGGYARPDSASISPRDLDWQAKLARFLENHDEPRAAKAAFPAGMHEAAALSSPTFRPACASFTRANSKAAQNASRPIWFARRRNRTRYSAAGVLRSSVGGASAAALFAMASGACSNAFRPGTVTGVRIAALSPRLWVDEEGHRRLTSPFNYAGQSKSVLRPSSGPGGARALKFKDFLGAASYVRDSNDIAARGLYLDMPPWAFHVFRNHAWEITYAPIPATA